MAFENTSKEKICYIAIIIILVLLAIIVPLAVIQGSAKHNRYTPSNEPLRDHFLCGYFTLKKYYEYLRRLESLHEFFLKKDLLGSSLQKNEIHSLQVSHNQERKHIITVVGGIFGNDHKSVLLALHILNKLVWDCKMTRKLFRHFHVHIIPLLNPDGYNFSLSTPTNTYWIKNRSPQPHREPGVNLFHNFDRNFRRFKKTAKTPASWFPGPRAFSEMETKAFFEYFDKHKHNIRCVVLLRGTHNKTLVAEKLVTVAPGSNIKSKRITKAIITKALKEMKGFAYRNTSELKETHNGRFDNWVDSRGASVNVFNIRMDYRRVYGENLRDNIRALGNQLTCMILSFADSIQFRSYNKTDSIYCY